MQKKGHLKTFISMTTGQTPSANEVHVIQKKAPEQRLNEP